MKVSYNWLKDFIEIDWPAEKVEQLLTNLGLEVEGITHYESVKGSLKGVVTGKVLSCEKHPNADKLKLTRVDIGEKEPLQIVCGAPNVAEGQMVPIATVGTTLYDKKNGEWLIKKSKIRGEESYGMICAEDELGLGENHDGIMVLDPKVKVGQPLADIIKTYSDWVFDIDLTPNRSDAMSHYGVARDLRAGLRERGVNCSLNESVVSKFRIDNHTRNIPIEILDAQKSPRYCGITISNLNVGPSPEWLKNRLKAIGLSSINNVVDATNYVMHDLGQPFHAFDADHIKGQRIIVKTVKEGTKFVTLDGVERKLSAEDLMICDKERPLCIAGVFGGLDSGVTENTKTVFLESAYFDPISVRKTAKRHGLNTDASFRFERGIDPNLTDFALKRLVLLIQEVAGGLVSSELNDVYPKKIEDFEVFLRFERLNRLIGKEIDQAKLKSILASLGIQVKNITETGIGLTIPPFRTDVNREVDVIEEVLRIYGYNNVEINEKLNATIVQINKYDDHNIQKVVANQLMGQGFYEIMSNSLTDKDHTRIKEEDEGDHNVYLMNPLSADLEVMRQSLLPGGLQSIAFNINRQNENLRFFEFGKTYHKRKNEFVEDKHLGIFVTGKQQEEGWDSDRRESGFFYLKGILKALFRRLGFVNSYEENTTELFSDGLGIKINRHTVGHFGALKTPVVRAYGIDQAVFYADINWDEILRIIAAQPKLKVHSIPKFPKVRRDFALLLDESIQFTQVEKLAFKTDFKLLKEVNLFDVYQGQSLPANKKSYAVSFIFLDEKTTLTDKKVDKIMSKLRKQFEDNLGATLR